MASRAPRIAHLMWDCFERTHTFVYDLVTAPLPFEAWCLTDRVLNSAEFPFPRIQFRSVQHSGRRFWDFVDRALWRIRPGHRLPLRRAMRAIRPALIHAHFAPNGCSALTFAGEYGLGVLTSFYGWDASSLPNQGDWHRRLVDLFARGNAFAVEGPEMRERLVRLGCAQEKIHIVPLIVHTERYRWHPRILAPGQPFRILFVGRFVAKKGLAVLLTALSRVRQDLSPVELVIVGGGSPDNEKEVRRLAGELRLADVAEFRGFQSRAGVLEQMARAHVLAVPSLTAPDGDTEGGAPTVLLEAQLSGLPFVSTRHADIPFVSAPAYHEFLAEEGDAEDFAGKLLAVRDASPRWPDLAALGRGHVEAQHSTGAQALLVDLYQRMIARGAQAPWLAPMNDSGAAPDEGGAAPP